MSSCRNWKSASWIGSRQWWFDSECWIGGGRLNEDCQNATAKSISLQFPTNLVFLKQIFPPFPQFSFYFNFSKLEAVLLVDWRFRGWCGCTDRFNFCFLLLSSVFSVFFFCFLLCSSVFFCFLLFSSVFFCFLLFPLFSSVFFCLFKCSQLFLIFL